VSSPLLPSSHIDPRKLTSQDGEDSQMHDNASLPSSTPSTPPASSHHHPADVATAAGTVSPPNSQPHAGPALQGQGQPLWAGKRAAEEAEHAKERCVDRGFSLRGSLLPVLGGRGLMCGKQDGLVIRWMRVICGRFRDTALLARDGQWMAFEGYLSISVWRNGMKANNNRNF
jgi:hypothetical protein